MQRNDDPGDPLEDMAQIHPALDRLRNLVTSATILDLKASADGYWAEHPPEDAGENKPGDEDGG